MQLETMYSERDGRVATIVLNRPHVLNCANEQWARDLNTIVDDLAADHQLRLVVLRGAGRAFCSGIDLTALAGGETTMAFFRNWETALRKLETMDAIVLAAVQSHCDLSGLSEVIGPGVAAECVETKDGSVIWEDHFYPEVIDPETGAVLSDGERGELVFTSLTKEALPVIRYRTRDLTTLLPPTARSMRRMAKVTGRTDDMLIIRGVNVFPSQIEELILRHAQLTPHYVLELSREGALDQLTVKVEPHRDMADQSDMCHRAAIDLQRQIKSYIGVSALVMLCDPGTIERSIGKAKRVIDARARG